MTPPHSLNSPTNRTTNNVAAPAVFDPAHSDDPEDLTFDELREMPMRLALSFDSSLDH